MIKLYTEEQVLNTVNAIQSYIEKFGIEGAQPTIKNHLKMLAPIELPSDEEAGVIALKIADTLKDKLTTEQEGYFIAGFQTYPKWLKEQILNQNK